MVRTQCLVVGKKAVSLSTLLWATGHDTTVLSYEHFLSGCAKCVPASHHIPSVKQSVMPKMCVCFYFTRTLTASGSSVIPSTFMPFSHTKVIFVNTSFFPYRDFLSMLITFDRMVKKGYAPSERIFRNLALLPSRANMGFEHNVSTTVA